ncbi:MAG TPA: hypothetical protein VFS21_11855 [Roseiflexaceae bacterium]|nr:hypothetical protein [Roseiflexaceae bacterium]
MSEAQMQRIQAAQELTREYASYTHSRSGLGNVLGGIAGLVVYFSGLLWGPGVATAAVTIVATVVWLVGKEVLRRRVYQAFGAAREPWPASARRLQIGLVTFLTLVTIGILVVVGLEGSFGEPRFWPYILFVAAIPPIAWCFLRTSNEFIVGVFLLCACAVTSAGGAYDLAGIGLAFFGVPIVSVVLLVLGVQEHRHFLGLRARLRAIQGHVNDAG